MVIYLEIFSHPQVQVVENSRRYVLLRTDILQKTVIGFPCTVIGDSREIEPKELPRFSILHLLILLHFPGNLKILHCDKIARKMLGN